MIVAVAYRLSNGLVLSLPAPAFHAEVRQAAPWCYQQFRDQKAEPGFMSDAGGFLTLPEAMQHAQACGQLVTDAEGHKTLPWGA